MFGRERVGEINEEVEGGDSPNTDWEGQKWTFEVG